jgi:hypothetical protein
VQRIIGAHPAIATVSEPWVLLPLLSALEADMCAAKYGHALLVEAVADLCKQFPRGIDGYYASVRAFAATVYGQLSQHEQRYFLDKTPRYHLIARRLLDCFPKAKVVLIWRNPLAVLASEIHSYGNVWRAHLYKVDIYSGVSSLIDAYQANADRICAVRYEDVVASPETAFRKIFDYLGLDFRSEILGTLDTSRLQGKMGDKSGVASYRTVSTEPLEKWKYTLANPTRRAWCRRYLRWLGQERLHVMGYDMQELLRQLNDAPVTWRGVPTDLVRMAYGEFFFRFTPGFKDQFGVKAPL